MHSIKIEVGFYIFIYFLELKLDLLQIIMMVFWIIIYYLNLERRKMF